MSLSNSTYPSPNNSMNPILSPATPSQLSCQSALWALVAIALNTMTHSSPYSNSLFSDSFSLFRASPIYCLSNISVILFWVLKLTVFTRPRIPFLKRYNYPALFPATELYQYMILNSSWYLSELLGAVILSY